MEDEDQKKTQTQKKKKEESTITTRSTRGQARRARKTADGELDGSLKRGLQRVGEGAAEEQDEGEGDLNNGEGFASSGTQTRGEELDIGSFVEGDSRVDTSCEGTPQKRVRFVAGLNEPAGNRERNASTGELIKGASSVALAITAGETQETPKKKLRIKLILRERYQGEIIQEKCSEVESPTAQKRKAKSQKSKKEKKILKAELKQRTPSAALENIPKWSEEGKEDVPVENKGKTPTICISTLLTALELRELDLTREQVAALPADLQNKMRRRSSHTQGFVPLTSSGSHHNSQVFQTTTEKIDRDKALERNIDQVVFGDVQFKSWYPSWYPKEIIGEKALMNPSAGGEGKSIVVQTLYVCKRCFGYAKGVEEWVRHCRECEKPVPGRKIYTHGKGPWSVWEVDGDVDSLYCQNLSLFAKLFLDNKSVFFDVQGFNYFLLVHTSPTTGADQVIGFFSKEKMSWDSNNLACILVFPPWQRKGLGSILMGVSYEISRREEILGGPEKPISDLGKKGYMRFWSAEIARWLLAQKDTDKKGKGALTIEAISRGTWILQEDCLAVLRAMGGVVERVEEKGAKEGESKRESERVRIDKARIREWVDAQGVSLERVVDLNGFVDGYGYKAVESGGEET